MPQTDFRPAANGFQFSNQFVNKLFRLSASRDIISLGRCGGMSFTALDYYASGLAIPSGTSHDYAGTGGVPPDGTALADYIYRRQVDSFMVPSAVKFILWSVVPDKPCGLLRGVDAWSRQDEFTKLRMAIDDGRPVPLGLVVATSLKGLGHNHQVVAWGYELDASGAVEHVRIYDNNHPGVDVTLSPDHDGTGWQESTGEHWRGFFVQDYTPQHPPPVLTDGHRYPPNVKRTARQAVRRPVLVLFESVEFTGDGWRGDTEHASLELAVNGRLVRWPHHGARAVTRGSLYGVNRSLLVNLIPPDRLEVHAAAGAVATAHPGASTPQRTASVSLQAVTQSYSSDDRGRGSHRVIVEGPYGCVIRYAIHPGNGARWRLNG